MALAIQSHYNLIQAQSSNEGTLTFEFDEIKPITKEPGDKKIPSHFKKKYKNQVKTGLVSFIYGEIPFYYERYVRDFLSIQIGTGITIRSFYADLDYIIQFGTPGYAAYSTDYGIDNWTGPDEYDEPENYHGYAYRKSSIGPYISIAPRFYTGGMALEGFYISPFFSYSVNNYKIPNVDVNGTHLKSKGVFKEKIKNTYIGLNIGSQSKFENVVLDMYLSAGYKIMNGLRQDIGYYYKELNSIDYEYEYLNRKLEYKIGRPYIRIDFLMGYTWGKKKG